jgi:hypothetical protein
MSIFKDSFKQGVKDQLKARQEAILERTPQSLQYYNSRNAWIRVTSSVNVGGSSDLANKYVLQGGILDPSKKLRAGIGGTDKAYSNKSPDGKDYRLGIRPMPGITGVEIKSKSAYGSLREATINFQAWDIRQLEELELLYMRPGYTVLVEWGWSPYLNNNKSIGTAVEYIDDVLKGGVSKEDIWKKTFTKASKDGNYDSLYGFIKNYSWSARPDGGYDCTTTIISIGEVLESLKVNYGAHDTTINTNGLFTGGTFSRPFENDSNIKKSYAQNIIAGICNELYLILKDQLEDKTAGTFNGWNFFRFNLDIAGKEDDESDFNDEPQIYITLKDFVNVLNKHVLLSDSQPTPKPLIEISLTEGDHMNNPGSPLLCLGHPVQLSTNPSVCLIKNKVWADPVANLGLVEGIGVDFKTIKELMTNLTENYWYNDDYETTQLGIIGNIYVNLSYIHSLVVSEAIESGDRKEKNDIAVFDFLKSMMNGISTAIGNVATFDVFADPVDGKARIIDINYTDATPRNTVYDNAFVIETHNLKSTVRSYKLESQIFPEQSTTIAIGAQAEGGALGSDVNTLIDFNQNLTDRIIPKKEAPNSLSKTSTTPTDDEKRAEAKEKVKHLKESLDTITQYVNKIDPNWLESTGDFDVSESSKYSNALKDIINFWKTYVKNDNKNRSLIPTKLSLELDGIGGIVIGNLFRIPEELLPRGYKGDGAGPAKIGYIVTGLGHSLQSNDWKTNIDAQFIILDTNLEESVLTYLINTYTSSKFIIDTVSSSKAIKIKPLLQNLWLL